jgi:hypothetical protein
LAPVDRSLGLRNQARALSHRWTAKTGRALRIILEWRRFSSIRLAHVIDVLRAEGVSARAEQGPR